MLQTVFLLVAGLMPMAVAFANPCGELPVLGAGYGPFDYRTDRDKVGPVEKFHFTPRVEALIGGATGQIGQDLEYVLDKFPNHHKALLAVMRLAERHKSLQLEAMTYPVECYFERALRFRSDDTVTRSMFAIYLGRLGRKDDALKELDFASKIAGDNALTHFNIGLVYTDLGAYPAAVASAQRAKALGLTRTELIDRLRQAGQWPDSAKPAAATETRP